MVMARPGLRLLPQRAHRPRLRGRRAATADRRPASSRPCAQLEAVDGPVARPRRRHPGQPDRHDAAARRAGRDRALVRGPRRPAGQRRDLPRHQVRRCRRRARLADLPRGGRLRLVPQVLLDDRLAARLDAGARGPAPPGRRAHRQLHDLPARARASTPPSPRSRRESYAELDGHVARYATNRRAAARRPARLGIDRLAPADGAFYVYADIGHLTDDSYAWCLRLLDETGVATAPGIDFDTRPATSSSGSPSPARAPTSTRG